MFATAYMGRKRWAQPYDRFFDSNQEIPFAGHGTLSEGTAELQTGPGCSRKAIVGAAPRLFRPMYAVANMGHPSNDLRTYADRRMHSPSKS